MTEEKEGFTVLIGGIHGGQPISCTTPPLRNLVILTDGSEKNESYTLRACVKDSEHRLFYILDGLPEDQASVIMRDQWPQGLLASP